MTRTMIGGLAAGTFAIGLLAGLVVPGALARADHDRLMTDHMAATGVMMNGSMGPMMNMGSMMGGGAMPLMPAGNGAPAGYGAHHTWPPATR